MHPPPIPRSRSSQTIASVGIPSSPSFSRRQPPLPTSSSSIDVPSTDDIDSDWELPENPSSPTKPRKVVGYAPLEKEKKVGGPRGLPGRGRLPSTLTRAEVRKEKGGETSTAGDSDRVLVCVRMKPPLPESPLYDCSTDTNTISLGTEHPNNKKRGGVTKGREQESEFTVDHLHLPPTPTSELFERVVSPLVSAAMDGFDGTVFAYGMTGSGKTYTMAGVPEDPGVIPRAIDQIFDVIDSDPTRETTLRVSYLELYNEQFKDLLNPGALIVPSVHELNGRICVRNLQQNTVRNPEDVQRLLKIGHSNRKSGKTDFNEQSSRSHSIFTITIESRPVRLDSSSDAPASGPTQLSRLNLIDLAGSEKAASDVARQKEGAYINKSLLVLSTVIEKLTEPNSASSHIPYRNSKLTRLLQDSLSGHARIAVICTVSFEEKHAFEAVATLKFARRASRVVTKAERGTVASDESVIQLYENEIASLRAQLAAIQVPSQRDSPNPDDCSDSEDGEELESEKQRLEDVKSEMAKYEQEVYQLELKRTKLQSQIHAISEFTLRSEDFVSSSSGSPQEPSRSRRRRISDVPNNGLGLGVPSGAPLGLQRRHVSALGVVDEDAAGSIGKGRRGDRMLGVGMGALSEEASNAKELVLEAELVDLRMRLAQLQASETTLIAERDALVATLQAEIQTLQTNLLSLSAEREESATTLSKLRQDLDSVSTERTSSREELVRLQAQVDDLVKQREQDGMSAKVQSSSVSTLQDTIASLRSQMREQDDQVGTLQAQLLAAESSRDAFVESARSSQAELQSQVDSLGTRLAELEDRRKQEAETMKEELEKTKKERDNLVATTEPSDIVQLRISNLEDQLLRQASEHEVEAQALRSKVEEAVSTLATSSSADRVWTEDLERQLESERREIEQLRTQAVEAEQRRNLESQETSKEVQELRIQLAAAEQARIVGNQSSSQEMEVLRTQLAEAQEASITQESSSSKEMDDLRKELEESRLARSASESHVSELKRRVEEAAQELSSVAEARDEDAIKAARMESELSTMAQRVESLNKQLLARPSPSNVSPSPSPRKGIPASPSISEGLNLHHSGSLRESRRPLPTSNLPYTLSSRMDAVSEDKEEIARLNQTISTQRELLSQQSLKMGIWHTAAKRNDEIINQLLSGTPSSSFSFNHDSPPQQQQPGQLPTSYSTSSSLSSMVDSLAPSTPRGSSPPSLPSIPAPPPTSTPLRKARPFSALAESTSSENRILPSTPNGSHLSSYISGSPKPPPLPHAGHQRSNSQARAARRVTIEHDMEKLKGSSRVEQSKSLFNSPAPLPRSSNMNDTPTRKF